MNHKQKNGSTKAEKCSLNLTMKQ